MKIHFLNDKSGYIVDRTRNAVVKYAPQSVRFVDTVDEAEIVIIIVSGSYHHLTRTINKLLAKKKKYCMIQYILYSSKCRDPYEWLKLWQSSELVWSYLPLHTYVNQDFNFYFAPFGVDDVFRRKDVKHRKYLVMTSGHSWMVNSVRETYYAANHLNKNVAHLGLPVRNKEGFDIFTDIPDDELCNLYNNCQYISCLRHTEGFEVPGIEGLICGARPIVFDQPHYKNWYGKFAEYIPELTREEITKMLIDLFSSDYREVTDDEIEEAKEIFNWEKIITGFWERLLQ